MMQDRHIRTQECFARDLRVGDRVHGLEVVDVEHRDDDSTVRFRAHEQDPVAIDNRVLLKVERD